MGSCEARGLPLFKHKKWGCEVMAGWIKLHRDLSQHWLWGDEQFTRGQAWVDLLLHANHSDKKFSIKNQLIDVKRGQQARSELTLSATWKWSRGKVRRFLKQLENEHMIVQQTTQLTSIITICNYDDFQGLDSEGDTPSSTADGTPDGTPNEHQTVQQAVHKQECKELKNDKNVKKTTSAPVGSHVKSLDFSSWPEMPSEQTLEDWTAMRKRLKAHVSQTVITRFSKELHLAVSAGVSVDECLAECVTRNWRGFKYEWMAKQQNSGGVITFPKSSDGFINKHTDRDWAKGLN